MKSSKVLVVFALSVFSLGSQSLAAPKITQSQQIKQFDKEPEICSKLNKDITENLKNIARLTSANVQSPVSVRAGKILFELEISNKWNIVKLSYTLLESNDCKKISVTPGELLSNYLEKAEQCTKKINDLTVFNSSSAQDNSCKQDLW